MLNMDVPRSAYSQKFIVSLSATPTAPLKFAVPLHQLHTKQLHQREVRDAVVQYELDNELYIIKETNQCIRLDSPHPDIGFSTYRDYFKHKYKRRIDQPNVFLCDAYKFRCDGIKRSLLIPSLCKLFPLCPSSFTGVYYTGQFLWSLDHSLQCMVGLIERCSECSIC